MLPFHFPCAFLNTTVSLCKLVSEIRNLKKFSLKGALIVALLISSYIKAWLFLSVKETGISHNKNDEQLVFCLETLAR